MNDVADLTLPTDETPVRDAALIYARAGFAPVPIHGISGGACTCGRSDCDAIGKHPVGKDWQKRASADIDRTRDLFAHHAGNIGLVVGGGLVVVDIDYYHDGAAGLVTLPEMPDTLTAVTGSGAGEHRVFRLAQGQDANTITNRAVAPGVDVKIRNGQIVVAPSRHRSGGVYRWARVMPPAELPAALYEALQRPSNVVPLRSPVAAAPDALRKRAAAYMARVPEAVSGEHGHDRTFAAARAVFGWVAKGLDESTAWGLLVDYNARCRPPWSEVQLRHKFDEARKAQRIPSFEDRQRPGAPADLAAALAGSRPPAEPDWRARLIYEQSKSGADKLAKHHENAVVVLRYAPEWRGRVSFDEHAYRVIVRDAPWDETNRPAGDDSAPREWTDADTTRLATWIRRHLGGAIPVTDCDRAVQVAAEANRVHPFRDWLDSLRWDGTPRLDNWLTVCLGVKRSLYSSSVGAWWLISAVARTYRPGCEAHHVLILEGPQGISKSSALRTLAGAQWFSSTPIVIGRPDAYMSLQGKIIVELGEMGSVRRADEEANKVFFTSAVDLYRPPYGRRFVHVPRGCVFAGTINPAGGYLVDSTGARRYWPVLCGAIDLAFLAEVRAQLWAEARDRFRAGARWWPVGPEEIAMCSGEQSQRGEVDAWEGPVGAWVRDRDEVLIEEVWTDCLKGQIEKLDQRAQKRIATILRGADPNRPLFVGRRKRVLGVRRYVYERVAPVSAEDGGRE